MKRIIMLLLVLSSLLIVGCVNSEFESCNALCKSKEYYKSDNDCSNINTELVRKKCDISFEKIIEIKDSCFNECLENKQREN